MVHIPESNFAKKLKNQAKQLEDNLSTLDRIVELCSDPFLSEEELLKRASPMIEALAHDHPNVAKDLKEVLTSGNFNKIKDFFDQDVQRRRNL